MNRLTTTLLTGSLAAAGLVLTGCMPTETAANRTPFVAEPGSPPDASTEDAVASGVEAVEGMLSLSEATDDASAAITPEQDPNAQIVLGLCPMVTIDGMRGNFSVMLDFGDGCTPRGGINTYSGTVTGSFMRPAAGELSVGYTYDMFNGPNRMIDGVNSASFVLTGDRNTAGSTLMGSRMLDGLSFTTMAGSTYGLNGSYNALTTFSGDRITPIDEYEIIDGTVIVTSPEGTEYELIASNIAWDPTQGDRAYRGTLEIALDGSSPWIVTWLPTTPTDGIVQVDYRMATFFYDLDTRTVVTPNAPTPTPGS